ncbi:MAG: tRNA pseudouridine(55) synthase TruB, partial [Sediminibacterium sp.]|nr:tRNA pseudouridine(55) synthase TruB [Sediminibacterium sp.]
MKQKEVPPHLQPYLEGKVLLIHKPMGWTSFDVVRKIRNMTRVRKVGHAGTLDPLATGLLIVCTGSYTKEINRYMGMEKEYTATFTVGAVTPSYDLETEPELHKPYDQLTTEQIHAAAQKLTGNILQVPPQHSAIKKDGKPVYLSARKGIEVKLEPRPVTIYRFEITRIDLPRIECTIVCSTGTYIRSLAHDLGQLLGTGAYMSSLCRTRIGNFLLKDAISTDTLQEQINQSAPLSEG